MIKNKLYLFDISAYMPRYCTVLIARLLKKLMRIDYKNDIILHQELYQFIERNKKKWIAGDVECVKCEYRWTATRLTKLTHIECPRCKQMTEYYEAPLLKRDEKD